MGSSPLPLSGTLHQSYINLASILHRFYSGLAAVSHQFCINLTSVLHRFYNGLAAVLYQSYISPAAVLQRSCSGLACGNSFGWWTFSGNSLILQGFSKCKISIQEENLFPVCYESKIHLRIKNFNTVAIESAFLPTFMYSSKTVASNL